MPHTHVSAPQKNSFASNQDVVLDLWPTVSCPSCLQPASPPSAFFTAWFSLTFLITGHLRDIDFFFFHSLSSCSFFSFCLSVSHLFSSISVITSICFLHHLAALAYFPSPPLPPSLLSLWDRCCWGSFPNLLILSFFITPSFPPSTHTHTPHPSLLTPLPDRPWHKCICSIPPANRLASCYQRQGDGDNGFHHIFSLLQIKMGQVAHHTHTNTHKQSPHTHMFIPKHTHTNIYTCTVESTMSKKVKKFPQIFTDITAQIQQQQHTNT